MNNHSNTIYEPIYVTIIGKRISAFRSHREALDDLIDYYNYDIENEDDLLPENATEEEALDAFESIGRSVGLHEC
ncbi:hypothetical protein GCM10023208_25360 [Erythrobacter westpacificensis]|uniref:Uncharacterized protein n=1 Tax=Erythrobacter westpacificensis TaxID=1055231 RepID=A0ABP9KKF4_9SPHN